MRFSAVVTLFAGAALGCTYGDTRCSGNTIQSCIGEDWIDEQTCSFPEECTMESGHAECEVGGRNARILARTTVGDDCPDDGAYDCTDNKMSVLQCQGGKWYKVDTCVAPDMCIVDGQSGYCGLPDKPDQHNIALAPGDDCPNDNDGLYECAEGGMSVLQCQSGKWVDTEDCTSPDVCLIDGQGGYCGLAGKLDQRNFARAVGDDCPDADGVYECAEGGMSVLQCQGGKWVDVEDCTSPDKCLIDGQGGYCGLPGRSDPRNLARGTLSDCPSDQNLTICSPDLTRVYYYCGKDVVETAWCTAPQQCILNHPGGYCGIPSRSHARSFARGT